MSPGLSIPWPPLKYASSPLDSLASSTICLQSSRFLGLLYNMHPVLSIPWPPLQCASSVLDSLLCLSIHSHPSFSGPWTRHPANSFLVFLFVLLHKAFHTSCWGLQSCI